MIRLAVIGTATAAIVLAGVSVAQGEAWATARDGLSLVVGRAPESDLARSDAAQEMSRRVDANFTGATFADVARWLREQGVAFAVDRSDVDENARLELHGKGVPLSDVMAAIERAWGGRFEKVGAFYVFQRGSGPRVGPRRSLFVLPPNAPLTPEQRERLEDTLKRLREDTADMRQRFRASAPELRQLEEMMRQAEKRLHEWRAPDAPKAGEREETKDARPVAPKRVVEPGKLMASITEAQWELHRKQGHLKLSDLTAAQRAMIGDPKGSYSLSIVIDGKRLEVRDR
jgi:hypothetical protein